MNETPITAARGLPEFFISRAGVDAPFAAEIGRIIESAAHSVVLQQWDFANRNFMERMHAALSSGARVIALLSNEYLASKHCEAEWLNAIANDPLNTNAGLIVLRVSECTPTGLLRALAYWDLVPIRHQSDLVRDVVLTAIKLGRHKGEGTASPYWRAARTVLHQEIKPTPSFTGRGRELLKIGNALRCGATAVAVYGLGGIGKSAVAREYAFQAQNDYAGIWWLSAARAPDSKLWDGVEKALVELGSIFVRDLDKVQDRKKAAHRMLEFIAHGGFAKPWLLVFDNVDDPAVLRHWAPVGNARVLMTSRLAAWGTGVTKVEIKEWPKREAISYLRKESRRSDLTAATAEAITTALGRLPLALSHAAAYLRENENATPKNYLGTIARHMRKAPESAEYDRAVFATFQQQIEEVDKRAEGARAILSVSAFYAPDDIPEELFTQLYPAELADVLHDPLKLEEAIGALNRFSLINFAPRTRTFSVHRLVQAAARDALANEASEWAQGALLAAFSTFPTPEFNTWPICERLASHVRAVTSQVSADSQELAWLLTAAATYLHGRAALADVLPLYERGLAITGRLAQADPGNLGLQRDLSLSHERIGDLRIAQGNLPAALGSYQASLTITDRLAKANPENAEWQRDLSSSHDRIGDVLVAQGNLPAALDSYNASLAIRNRLTEADPGNAEWQRGVSISLNKIGEVLIAQGNLPAALDSYNASLAIRDRFAKANPENAEWQLDLSISHDRIGNVLVVQRKLVAALDSYNASLAIRDRLTEADPGNAEWQRGVSISLNKIGDVFIAQGNLLAALDSYQASLAISDRLAKADPGNAEWQRDLSLSHERIATVLRAQGDIPAALDRYNASLAIRDRLAKTDPGNLGLQRDLSISHEGIGDVLVAQGNLAAALESYNASLAIADRLAKTDPGNAEWQRGLSNLLTKIGEVLIAQGNLPAALESYNASLAITDRLAKANPENAEWQHDLSISHDRIGNVLVVQRKLVAALDSYNASLAIRDRLTEADPGNAEWQRDLSTSLNKIGDVHVAQGNLAAALDSYNASLAIRDRLTEADPGNAEWQRGVSISLNKIGGVRIAQGNLPAALGSYQASLTITDRLAKADPGNAEWQRDLSIAHAGIGDVLVAQGNLAAALESYNASLAITDRLTRVDLGNAEWQRDNALSHGRVGMIEARLGAHESALKALRKGRDIIARLKAQARDTATLSEDLSWFDSEIAALET